MLYPLHGQEKTAGRESKALLIGAVLIILVAAYFLGRLLWLNDKNDEQVPTVSETSPAAEESPLFIGHEALQAKLDNREQLEMIDIRPREAYDLEHIPGSVSVTPASLQSYNAPSNRPLIIISDAEDTTSREAVKNLLEQKALSFFFLEGGFQGWKLSGRQAISAGDPSSFLDQSKVTYISPAELKTLLQSSDETLVLLDVQSAENYRRSHLVGSINIPLEDLEKRKSDIPLGRQIVVYGENELASFQGGVRLSDMRFFSVRTLSGNDHLSASSPLFREP